SEEGPGGWRGRQQLGRPVETAMTQPGPGETRHPGIAQHAVDGALVLGHRGTGERERDRPQIEVEQAVARAGLVVVIARGLRGGDDLDLPAVEAETLVDRANLRLGRLRV